MARCVMDGLRWRGVEALCRGDWGFLVEQWGREGRDRLSLVQYVNLDLGVSDML